MKNVKRILAIVLTALLVLSVFSACAITPEKKILGSWRDSTGTTGYEFLEGNTCVITYADVTVPIVNIKYNGSVNGAYQITEKEDGNHYVTITYTILAKSISKEYKFVVDGETLTLTDVEDGSATVYMAYAAPEETTTSAATAQ